MVCQAGLLLFITAMPWCLHVHRAHSLKSSPANSLGQDPLLNDALGNCLYSPLDFRFSQGMCLLGVVVLKRLFEIMLSCARCKRAIRARVRDQIPALATFSHQSPGTKSFTLKGWFKLWCSSVWCVLEGR